jgi:biotin transport system permease protein
MAVKRGKAAIGSTVPWSYKKGSSPLHKFPAGAKLGFLLLLSLAAFFPGTEVLSLAIITGIALIIISLSLIAGISPHLLLRGSAPLLFIVIAVFLFQAVEFSPLGLNFAGLRESIIFCVRIGTAFAAGSLLFSVTTSGEIRKSLSRLETFLKIKKLNLSLSISLMLGFIPMLFQIWEDLNLTWKSKGGNKNLSRMVKLVPLLVERMMLKAVETATAMESRGMGIREQGTGIR